MTDEATPREPARFLLASGTRVLDRYTLQRGLGVGGFGEVYFAISDAGKEVALKRVERNLEVELRGDSNCLNVKHPNLVALHDIIRDAAGQTWVVMEYVAGPNLAEVLAKHPQGLDRPDVLRWFCQSAAAVDHLHQQGIVHRDLKPANLFDDLGVIKVGDYGLSKFIAISNRDPHTQRIGTPHYMAPEIGAGKYGPEIDIYALGLILFEMLTCRPLFDGESVGEIQVKHLTQEADLAGIAPPFRRVIEVAVRKDPQRRWGTAAEMARELDPDVPVIARPRRATAATTPVTTNVVQDMTTNVVNDTTNVVAVTTNVVKQPAVASAAVGELPAPSVPQGQRVPGYARHPARMRQTLLAWQQARREAIAAKPASSRLAELSGSVVAAAVATALCAGGLSLLGLRQGDEEPKQVAWYMGAAIVAWLSATLLMALGKWWEGHPGSFAGRRWMAAAAGGVVGWAAAIALAYLMIPLATDATRWVSNSYLPPMLYDVDPAAPEKILPKPAALAVHFAIVMGLVRWWGSLDPLRRRRINIWSVIGAMGWGLVVNEFFPIPQWWGMCVVGLTMVAIQVASVWEGGTSMTLGERGMVA